MKIRMKDWPVGVRVGIGFFTLNLGMIIVAAGGWWGLHQVQDDLRRVYEEYTVPSTKLVTVSTNLLRYRNSVIQAIGARSSEEFKEFSGGLPGFEQKVRTPLEEYASLYGTASEGEAAQGDEEPQPGSVEALNQAVEDYFWLDGRTIKQATAGWKSENPEDRERLHHAAQQNGFFTTGPGLDDTASNLEAVLSSLRDQAASVHQQSIQTVNFATNMVFAVLAICTVLSVMLGVFIVKGVTSPLQALRDMFHELGQGNLSCQVQAKGQDELGQLCDQANRFVGNLRDAISQVAEATKTVASASGELIHTSEEVKAGSQEQARQSEQAAAAVEEMSVTSGEISHNTKGLCSMVEEANEAATQGGAVVRESITGMQTLAQSIQQSAHEITILGQRSQEIGEIIKVIEDIADQTNLLALNAAIEAARAGEQGRGFAVVADEVRKLAERTTKATKEIGDVIKTIQSTTNQAVIAMERGTQGVEEGVEKGNEAGTQLTRIVDDAKTVTMMVQQIAEAIQQQSLANVQVSENIQTVASVSQQNSTSVERVAASSQSLSQMVDQLQSAVGQFRL